MNIKYIEDITNLLEYSLDHTAILATFNGKEIDTKSILNLYKNSIIGEYTKNINKKNYRIENLCFDIARYILGYNSSKEYVNCISSAFKSVFVDNKFNIPVDDIIEFLTTCKESPVVDLNILIQTECGKLINFVDEKYKDLLTKILPTLLELMPLKSGMGSWGKGELALMLLCKGEKSYYGSDLLFDKKFIEVKSCMKSKLGARLQSKSVYPKMNVEEYTHILESFIKNNKLPVSLNIENKNYINSFYISQPYNYPVKYTNFGFNFIQNFNSWAKDIDKNTRIEFIKDILLMTIKEEHRGLINTDVYNNIFQGNNVSYEKLVKAHSYNLYKLYEINDDVSHFCFLNAKSGYFVITSSAEDFVNCLGNVIDYNMTILENSITTNQYGIT